MSEIIIKEMTKEDIDEMFKEADRTARIAGFESLEAIGDFKVDASCGMIKFGGSFTHYLGHALAHADSGNTSKIISAFKDECVHHAGLYRKWLNNRDKEGDDGA